MKKEIKMELSDEEEKKVEKYYSEGLDNEIEQSSRDVHDGKSVLSKR